MSLVPARSPLVSEWGGVNIHFKAEAGRMSVQLQKYETSMSTTDPTCDPPQAKPGAFISLVICFFVLGRLQTTQRIFVMPNWGKSGKQRQKFCSRANDKAPWLLSGIRLFTGAERCGGQIGARLNKMQLGDALDCTVLCVCGGVRVSKSI